MAKLGIDLGTANSAASVLFDFDKKNPVTIEPIDGTLYLDLVFPSYVAFNKQGKVSVAGLIARERYFSGQSELVVRHFKRLIGRPYDHVAKRISEGYRAFSEFSGRIKRADDGLILVTVGERDISIVEIVSYLLRKIVEDAQVLLRRRGEDIDTLTISLPAGFDDSQRQATLKAARMAGLASIDIQVIEEPTAAAIASGLGGVVGNIMVIDVGAGTTDVVIGHMEATEEGFRLAITSQGNDDLLGGIDMDNRILEYLLENDDEPPTLRDLLPNLGTDQQLRLMGKIEEAKIFAFSQGGSTISTVLPAMPPKRIHIPLNEAQAASIVAPVINGYSEGDHHKGVRAVVERALLNAAGGKLAVVPRVIKDIQWLLLVGGPCQMGCMHTMLKDVFGDNQGIVQQLEKIDRWDRFFKEGVARGAALSQLEGIDATIPVPWTLAIFSWEEKGGMTPVIAGGTPYRRGKGISKFVTLPLHEGSNRLWVLSQKESESLREWSMRKHIINVPQEGDLKVTLVWGEGGIEADKARIEGCGLPAPIDFPQMSNTVVLGAELESAFRDYFGTAKRLRGLLEEARSALFLKLLRDPGTTNMDKIEQSVDEVLNLSEFDLKMCEAIDPDKESTLSEAEIKVALKEGYFGMRRQLAAARGLPSRAIEVLEIIFSIWRPANAEELIAEAKKFLTAGQSCATCSQFHGQLTQWLRQFELNPKAPAVAAATVTSLGALADCLYNQRLISEVEFHQIKDICWRFRAQG
jgi:molecular chaperone DnaK (HSP70)